MKTRARHIIGLILTGLLFTTATAIAADEWQELLDELDLLHHFDENERILSLLDAHTPANERERGHLLWRRARAQVSHADLSNWDGVMSDADAIALLEEAETNADRAIEFLNDEADPWFWRAAATGLRGQLRGVLNSLFLASDVRDYATRALEYDADHPEVYYLLGQLYRELPGWPISFGNKDYAVSLARRAVILYEELQAAGETPVKYYDHYTQLAHALWERNYNTRRRERWRSDAASDYRSARSPLERGFYFDGTVPISDRTDREEALEIVRWVVGELSRVSNPRVRQRMDLSDAKELLEAWR